MTNAEFYKSFAFRFFDRQRAYHTNCVHPSGCPKHYVAHMVKGSAKFQYSTNTLHLKAGDIFYLPHGLKYHSYWYPDGDSVEFYSFGFDYFPEEEPLSYGLQIIDCTSDELAMLHELEEDIAVNVRSIGLLYRFLGTVQSKLQLKSADSNQLIVNKAVEYIRENTNCSVSDIARRCGISESGLYAKFRKHLGQTPVDVRQNMLIEKATALLTSTDLSVEEISDRLGFSSSSYFRKVFRAKIHATPTAYRKSIKNI